MDTIAFEAPDLSGRVLLDGLPVIGCVAACLGREGQRGHVWGLHHERREDTGELVPLPPGTPERWYMARGAVVILPEPAGREPGPRPYSEATLGRRVIGTGLERRHYFFGGCHGLGGR